MKSKSEYHRENQGPHIEQGRKHFKQMDESKFGKLKKKIFYMMLIFRESITWPEVQYAFIFSNYKKCLFGTP